MDYAPWEEQYREVLNDLITANHILHHHKVVDAFGHISVRNPSDPSIYIMSGSVAPALVESPEDLIEYHVEDSSPIDPTSQNGYLERFIHGEIYKRFAGVDCVVHSHSEAVVPYTIGNFELMPVYHMAGFLGTNVPIFDITEFYSAVETPHGTRNMLVSNSEYGDALARKFEVQSYDENYTPDDSVVLMAKHGFTAVGTSIQSGVFRAIYTQKNAEIQTTTTLLNGAMAAMGKGGEEEVAGLSDEEARDCGAFGERVVDRPWDLWVREVETCGLYKNRMNEEDDQI